MSIRVTGNLVIKEIRGANGRFCVGDLHTELGVFKIKEPVLDQFSEGQYQGEFLISRIFLSTYTWAGRLTTEMRAKVMDIFLESADEGKVEESQSEPDPISTEPPADRLPVAASTEEAASTDTPVPAVLIQKTADHVPEFQALLDLFGADLADQVRDRMEVKLDPSVDRPLFRLQRDRLKEIGYVFDAKLQSWAITKEGESS